MKNDSTDCNFFIFFIFLFFLDAEKDLSDCNFMRCKERFCIPLR